MAQRAFPSPDASLRHYTILCWTPHFAVLKHSRTRPHHRALPVNVPLFAPAAPTCCRGGCALPYPSCDSWRNAVCCDLPSRGSCLSVWFIWYVVQPRTLSRFFHSARYLLCITRCFLLYSLVTRACTGADAAHLQMLESFKTGRACRRAFLNE